MWLRAGLLLLIGLGLFLVAKRAGAEPQFQADGQGVTIIIYSEECQLKDQVVNLVRRATWTQNGKTNEGCVAFRPDLDVLVFWFDDKTVAVAPAGAFRRVTGT